MRRSCCRVAALSLLSFSVANNRNFKVEILSFLCVFLAAFFPSQLIHFPVFVSVFLHHFKCALSDLTSYLHWFLTVAADGDRAPAVCLTTTAWFCIKASCLFGCPAACCHLCCSLVLRLTVAVPQVQSEDSVLLFVTAWTVTEIIRYSFYTFSLLNHLPYLIKWAR